MQLTRVSFEDVAGEVWDSWVDQLPTATHLHSASWIGFCHARSEPSQNHSFAILDNQGEIVAICPLGLSEITHGEGTYTEATWDGIAPGVPAIRADLPSQRRRLRRDVFDEVHGWMADHSVQKAHFRVYPMTISCLSGSPQPIDWLEPLSEGYECVSEINIMVDLGLEMNVLEGGMTKERRKIIRQAEKKGVHVVEYRGKSADVTDAFNAYQDAHAISAGGAVRPQRSFDYMLGLLESGHAGLFAAFVEDVPISFLYCLDFKGSVVGWSQANLESYEKEYSPRHLLEWSTITAYKERGFKYYGVGNRWYGPRAHHIPTEKEVSISWFKERYGGELWPDLWFERFFDRDLYKSVLCARTESFSKSDHFRSKAD